MRRTALLLLLLLALLGAIARPALRAAVTHPRHDLGQFAGEIGDIETKKGRA